jgi:hypothetical protein
MFMMSGLLYDKVAASDASSETTVTGHITPSLIKVSAPAKIIFSIDPNAEERSQFISSQITIKNNSNAPVKVKINSGAQNFIQTVDSKWKPLDVLPDAYEWDRLGTDESESYLALGIRAGGEGWRDKTKNSALYVKEQNTSLSSIEFGEIDSNSDAELTLVCSHGLSFGSEKECTYTIIWTFSLGD